MQKKFPNLNHRKYQRDLKNLSLLELNELTDPETELVVGAWGSGGNGGISPGGTAWSVYVGDICAVIQIKS